MTMLKIFRMLVKLQLQHILTFHRDFSAQRLKKNSFTLYLLNPLRHSVSGAKTHTENSQLLKYIPEILYDFFTFIIWLQIAFTVLGLGLILNSGRILT